MIAFQQLIRQLKQWNAPFEFIQQAEKAIRDEKRHAAQMRMLHQDIMKRFQHLR